MYKFASHVCHGKLVLVRKKVGEGTCALMIMRAPRRCYAGAKPPHEQPSRPRPLLWTVVGASVLTGAAVVYAKNSPDARNFLTVNVPMADKFIALVYQENKTYFQTFSSFLYSVSSPVSNFLFGRDGVSPPDIKSRSQQDLDQDCKEFYARKDYELPRPAFEPLYIEEIVTPPAEEITTEATLIQTEECVPPPPLKIEVTKDLVDLEHEMHESTKNAIDHYREAAKFSTEYNKSLHKVVELSVEDYDAKMFASLSAARNERDSHAKKATEAAAIAKRDLDTLERMLEAGVQAPPEAIAATKRYIAKFRVDIAVAEKLYKEEMDKAAISDKYWSKVEAARSMFQDELQKLYPGLDLTSRHLTVKGDTDLLLLYTLKQVQFLQNELAEIQTIREAKLNRAIECRDDKEIIAARLEDAMKKEKLEREWEYQKKALLITAEAQRKFKEELKKQMILQEELLKDRLNKKESEVMGRMNRMVSEQLEKERVKFKQEIALMAGKLTAIENTLRQRAKAEADTKRSQSLWAAAEALLATTRRVCPEINVGKEIEAVEKAGTGDGMVKTVMKGIPKDTKVIITESALRQKYDAMEETAMKVALVGSSGAGLPIYFLSWIQYKLLFARVTEISFNELDNRPIDFTQLDTFDILHRARYYMDRGDISAALRYVNLLQGAPRAAAKSWTDAARRHLEVKQAAEAIMSHASAASLRSLATHDKKK